MLAHEAIAAALHDIGVRHFFGLMGRTNMSFLLDLVHKHGVEYIGARHETAAIAMADGYARRTGRLGVATVSLGPAVSNALTGILEASRGSTPMLVLTGDAPSGHGAYGQFLDQARMFESVGVDQVTLSNPAQVTCDLIAAADYAISARRPVVVTIPVDVQNQSVTVINAGLSVQAPGKRTEPRNIRDAVEAIEQCQRPVILAGRGALAPEGRAPLIRLGELTGALLATTLHADGLFSGEEFQLGVIGVHGSPLSARLLLDADLIMAFGTRLDRFATRAGHLFPAVRDIVHCDIDPESQVTAPVTVQLVGDTATICAELVEELERRPACSVGYRDVPWAKMSMSTQRLTQDLEAPLGSGAEARNINSQLLLSALDSMLPKNRAVVQECGFACGDAVAHLSVESARARVSTVDFEAIGLGLATAIGAAVGQPDCITVAAVGDGGLLMGLGELETAMRYQLPLLVLVLNNSAYGAEARELEMRGLSIEDAVFSTTNFAALGHALGTQGAQVKREADLAALLPWLKQPSGPFVLDCRLDPSLTADWFEDAIGSSDGFLRRPRPGWHH